MSDRFDVDSLERRISEEWETNALKARIAELEGALRLIAHGEGIYGWQAWEYKKIARQALSDPGDPK